MSPVKPPFKIFTTLSILAFFGLLAACGSGGGDESFNTNPTPAPTTGGSAVVFYGNLNETLDSSGNVKILGEVKNTGSNTLTFVKVRFDFYNSAGSLIESEETYVQGVSLKIITGDVDTDTALRPNDVGVFELYTDVDSSLVASYEQNILFDLYDTEQQSAQLDIEQPVTNQASGLGRFESLGTVVNSGSSALVFGRVHITLKDAAGLVIDTSFNYINGENIYLESIGSNTDTGLLSGHSGSFKVLCTVDFDDVFSHELRTAWKDSDATSAASLSTLQSFSTTPSMSESEQLHDRDLRIESIRKAVKSNR